MSCSGQVGSNEQTGISYINLYVPGAKEHVQQGANGWKSIRTAHGFQWSSDFDSGYSRPGHEKQLAPGQPAGQRIVLHIDDDEEDRTLLEEALQKVDATIKVQQVDSGKTALSFLRKSKEQGHLPCLIILDINMPGMNGKEVL